MQSLQSLLLHVQRMSAGWRSDLLRRWPECVGNLADHMSCARVENDVLFVAVHNSRWMHELFMLKPEIIASIKKTLPDATLQDIRFMYKPRFSHKKTNNAGPVLYEKKNTVVLTARERGALEKIADPELQAVLIAYRARAEQ